jgi:hypothetical protein
MAKNPDPTKDPEFQRVLKNMLSAPPKPHSEMKIGKKREPGKPSPRPRSRQKVDKNRNSPKAGG